MNIRRRLFISNILMIVIPVVLSLVISAAVTAVLWLSNFPEIGFGEHSLRQLYRIRTTLADLGHQYLAAADSPAQAELADRLERLLQKSRMTLQIRAANQQMAAWGSFVSPGEARLEQAIQALGQDGSVIAGDTELYAVTFTDLDQPYTVYIFSAPAISEIMAVSRTMLVVSGLMTVLMLGIVIGTNRFLTCFVFRKIEQPLDILARGVHQIRDGNLDYRIAYPGQDEFAPVCDDFNDMAVRLQASVALTQRQEMSRKELLVSISHDLRSPLTSIKAYAEGLLDGVARSPEARQRYVQMIQTKSGDIERMVAKLSLFSKMDLGDYPYDPEPLDLAQEIRSLADVVAEEFASQGLTITVATLAAPVLVQANPVLLRSILVNILENSLKYKGQAPGQAVIRSWLQGDRVWITLTDNGPGVPDSALAKLFDIFYRCDPSRSNLISGSGLGLAIAAKAAVRMGGSITAQNVAPHGLQLTIQLPVLPAADPTVMEAS